MCTANQAYLLNWRVYEDLSAHRLEFVNDFFVLLSLVMANVILVLEPVIDEPTEVEESPEIQTNDAKEDYIEGPIFDDEAIDSAFTKWNLVGWVLVALVLINVAGNQLKAMAGICKRAKHWCIRQKKLMVVYDMKA